MANSTKTNYSAMEINNGMQNGFVQFMNANKGKTANDVLQEMMGTFHISQDQLNLAQQASKKLEQQLYGLRNMFHL